MKKTPAPINHDEKRKLLLQQLERTCLRVAIRAMTPKKDKDDVYNEDGQPLTTLDALDVAYAARTLLEGKELPARVLKEREE